MKIELSAQAQTLMRERFTKLAETGVVPGSLAETYGLTDDKLNRLASMRYDLIPELTHVEVRAIEIELSVCANADDSNEELLADVLALREALA